MSDDEQETYEWIRRDLPIRHDYLCRACAHRFHRECEGPCTYCTTPCQCACGRWAVPLPSVEKK